MMRDAQALHRIKHRHAALFATNNEEKNEADCKAARSCSLRPPVLPNW